MALIFHKSSGWSSDILEQPRSNKGYLAHKDWDDFGHKTLFSLTVYDEQGNVQAIGNLKIGFVGQNGGWTNEHIPEQFEVLSEKFYSVGQNADYYQNIVENLSHEMAVNVLASLRDVVHDPQCLKIAENEDAFSTSLLRFVRQTSIANQFARILRYEAPLTEYDFFYKKDASERYSGITVNFAVEPYTKPSSNIHVLIGRNGVGKTTLLNNMVKALFPDLGVVNETGYFAPVLPSSDESKFVNGDYFAGVVSISFSAFDPFTPPNDQTDANDGMRYYYVGLKKRIPQQNSPALLGLKDINDLCYDFTTSLNVCFFDINKRKPWINAVRTLESDFNFAEMDLCELTNIDDPHELVQRAATLFKQMSSGHAIVLLTITKLVETVEHETLVLLDEPESHLHPPLLSAFTRALSDLLVNRNAVAIIATHSPVVLQEVPKSCVSILRRTRLIATVDRPESETFAENVGVLTREVFGLEVSKSGFHSLLENSVSEGKSYEEVEQEYKDQIGFEGKTILRSMIMIRDSQLETIE